MTLFIWQLSTLGEYPRNETAYFLTRADVIEAARAEIAELIAQRRIHAERLAQGFDSPSRMMEQPRDSMTKKFWISIWDGIAMRDVGRSWGSWVVSRTRRPMVHLGVQLF